MEEVLYILKSVLLVDLRKDLVESVEVILNEIYLLPAVESSHLGLSLVERLSGIRVADRCPDLSLVFSGRDESEACFLSILCDIRFILSDNNLKDFMLLLSSHGWLFEHLLEDGIFMLLAKFEDFLSLTILVNENVAFHHPIKCNFEVILVRNEPEEVIDNGNLGLRVDGFIAQKIQEHIEHDLSFLNDKFCWDVERN